MTPVHPGAQRVDRLFSTGEARLDRWYNLALAAQIWAAKPDKNDQSDGKAREPECQHGGESDLPEEAQEFCDAREQDAPDHSGGEEGATPGRVGLGSLKNKNDGNKACQRHERSHD